MAPNDPFYDDFRTKPFAFLIYVSALSIICTQSYMLKQELTSLLSDA